MNPGKRIAVLGAGPIGLEAALYGVQLGHPTQVFEQGRVGEHVQRWGHVRLFSPWRMNGSSLGWRALRAAGCTLSSDETCPCGEEYVARYLAPLARSAPLADRVHEGCRVVSVGRERIGKRDLLGQGRERHPFRLLLDTPEGERIVHADVVLDCTGTLSSPNWLGSGNVPAVGERHLRARIAYTLQDLTGRHRERYAGRRVLVVGAGHSAATALDELLRLEGTTVDWVYRRDTLEPLEVAALDPLPERARLSRQANALVQAGDPRVRVHRARVVESLEERGEGFRVVLCGDGNAGATTLDVDRVLAHVGYGPDRSLCQELQLHECYATLGPIKLSAALLESGADCLDQTSHGPEVLRNPEPGFFVLGSKSYGRNPNFLVRVGLEQVRDAFALIEDRPGLDLYAA
jgi:thioredoxin reductase